MNTPASTPDLDVERLHAYLLLHLPDYRGPLTVERFSGGQSNPTYKLSTPGRAYVMRSKPASAALLLPSAHAIEREYRVMAALRGSGVPVPQVHLLCTDEAVIGRAFYLMELVAGRIFWDQSLPKASAAERTAIYDEMNRVIAALHVVDVGAAGLGDFGRRGDYFGRQVKRWSAQYRASATEPIEPMDRLIGWLAAQPPPKAVDAERSALVHGDFRLDNLVFDAHEPRVIAVLDWELSTLGHPLADFGYHALSWHIPAATGRGFADLDLQRLGVPDEPAYLARYLQRSGQPPLDGAAWAYVLAFSLFRVAAILQGIARRALDGTASSAQAASTGAQARTMAELGWAMAQRAGGR